MVLIRATSFLAFLISLGVAVMGSFEGAYRGALFLISGVVVHLDGPSLEALRMFVQRSLAFQVPRARPVKSTTSPTPTSLRVFAAPDGAALTVALEIVGPTGATGES